MADYRSQSKFVSLFEGLEIFLNFGGESKVTDFNLILFQKDILGFEIPMDNLLLVDTVHTGSEQLDDVGWEGGLHDLFKITGASSASTVLHLHVQV